MLKDILIVSPKESDLNCWLGCFIKPCLYPSNLIHSTYLVVLPIPKEVNRAISPPLQHGPSSIVEAMFTPGLDQPIAAICLKQVHPTGGVACLSHLVTVLEGTWGWKDGCRKRENKWWKLLIRNCASGCGLKCLICKEISTAIPPLSTSIV